MPAEKAEPKYGSDHIDIKYDEKAMEAKRVAELKASREEYEERQRQSGKS